jgi:peptidylprolyl isomerase
VTVLTALLSLSLLAASPKGLTAAEVLEQSTPADWRRLDPNDTLYLDLPKGRVVIELAPAFAPEHVGNIRTLAGSGYFDGLTVLRAQDNYVVQWGDASASDAAKAKPLGEAKAKLPVEFTRSAKGLPFTKLPEADAYAPEVGWSSGFPVGRDSRAGKAWLAHCYGMVGAGRDEPADSSNGAELYAIIGHAPRHLDRNITLVGRVVHGIELFSTLPRGTGKMGFYEKPEEHTPILKARLAAAVPEAERTNLEVFRTDTKAFTQLVEARRNRREKWFVTPVGKLELCNVQVPTRLVPAP